MCCYGFNSIQIHKGISGLLEEENPLISVPFLKLWLLLSSEAEQITIKLKSSFRSQARGSIFHYADLST